MHVEVAHEGVDVRQDAQRELRRVGDAVVLGRVNVCRVGTIRRGCAIERHVQERDVEAGEARQQPADGIVATTNHDEGDIVRIRRTHRHQRIDVVVDDRGALRVAERNDLVVEGQLVVDGGIQQRHAFGDGLVGRQIAEVGGNRPELLGREQALRDSTREEGLDESLVDVCHVLGVG
ncbi:Uncharacterised protein [Mycobacterium tuberculosis]|nr:Uncharacterised protein [Mycobacterium tuberculosis]